MSSRFNLPHNTAFLRLGARTNAREWSSFDVSLDEARQGLANMLVVMLEITSFDGSTLRALYVDSAGRHWSRHAVDSNPKSKSHLDRIAIATSQGLPISGILRELKRSDTRPRRCSEKDTFQCTEHRYARDGSVWLRWRPYNATFFESTPMDDDTLPPPQQSNRFNIDELSGSIPQREEDVLELLARPLARTQTEALVQARLGQGTYRNKLLQLWDGRCAVTGIANATLLVASHAKPWREASDEERLDPENGLPLIANLDKLFDNYLISFDPGTGEMVVSTTLDKWICEKLSIPAPLRKPLTRKQVGYLTIHYEQFLALEAFHLDNFDGESEH